MLRIGHVRVDPPLLLAPMAGVTDHSFRALVRRIGGAGLVAMEFLASKGVVAGDPFTLGRMTFGPEERPLAIQIYGSDAATMAEAAAIVEAVGADVCDINMGCPANKVLKGCAGAALMGDPARAEAIIAAVRARISIPLTVKLRLGLDDGRRNHLELGRICEANGVDAVAVHGRTARQRFTGRADWRPIARLKEELAIPVIGNGDVNEPDDALRLFAATGCDGVMIGRGATRNPWIFRQIAARLSGGRLPEATLAERRDLMLGHFRDLVAEEPARQAMHKLRVFTRWYTQGLPEGHRLRRRIQELPDPPAFLEAVEDFFGELPLETAA